VPAEVVVVEVEVAVPVSVVVEEVVVAVVEEVVVVVAVLAPQRLSRPTHRKSKRRQVRQARPPIYRASGYRQLRQQSSHRRSRRQLWQPGSSSSPCSPSRKTQARLTPAVFLFSSLASQQIVTKNFAQNMTSCPLLSSKIFELFQSTYFLDGPGSQIHR